MPSLAKIQQYLLGAWRLMLGRQEGLKLLDVSADGFWDSFFAMVVALPPLLIGWVAYANELGQAPEIYGGKPSILVRLAVAEFGEWVLPLVVLALAARQAGIADRFVHYVVASNWATAALLWVTVPLPLLQFLLPADSGLLLAAAFAVFVISIIFAWRLTNATLNKGAGTATMVTAGIIIVSLLVSYLLQSALGLTAGAPPPA
jgi:hypothetical protein